MRRRNIALSLLGALIILASFVVKDVLQDATKEKVATLETLNSRLKHNDDEDIVLKTLDGIGDGICSLQQPDRKEPCAKFFALPSSEFAAEWLTLGGTLSSLPALPLWRDSSPREKYKKRLDDFYASFKLLEKEEKDYAAASQQPTDAKSTAEVHEDTARFISQAVQKTKHKTDLAVEKIALAGALSELIETEGRQNELAYEVCRILSYCLFALGWGLALYGKLFDVPGLSAAD